MSIRPLRDVVKQAILEAILETGSLVKAAQALGVATSTIYDNVHNYGLPLSDVSKIRAELRRQHSIKFRNH